MDFTQRDLMAIMNRERLFGNTTLDEQTEFITEQIAAPFDSGNMNYFKKIKKLAGSEDQLDIICDDLYKQIEDVYPDLEFDFDSQEFTHISSEFESCYKFFVKNISKLVYIFLHEYLLNNKVRKGIIEEFMPEKLSSYPKEQYGKKEYYILISMLNQIVKYIGKEGIGLEEFIEFIDKSDESTIYVERVHRLLDKGIIVDHGVVDNIFDLFEKSDARSGIMNKLEIAITESLIIPCLKDNGLLDIRISSAIAPADDEEETDTDSEDPNDVSDLM